MAPLSCFVTKIAQQPTLHRLHQRVQQSQQERISKRRHQEQLLPPLPTPFTKNYLPSRFLFSLGILEFVMFRPANHETQGIREYLFQPRLSSVASIPDMQNPSSPLLGALLEK
ncbi:MAG: hypothetical protein NT023_15635 [Armatimonadetes bacterium]|nr:hypothetical protein [Armatimonadota bacterium]